MVWLKEPFNGLLLLRPRYQRNNRFHNMPTRSQSVTIFSVLLLLFSSGCLTKRQQSSFVQGPLVTTQIWVDYDKLFKPETRSLFFVKLNDIIKKQHPNSSIRFFVDSQLLPALVVNGKSCDIFNDADYKKTICGEAPIFSNDRLVTLMDVLKLYCDITVTEFEYRDNIVFIVRPKKDKKTPRLKNEMKDLEDHF